MKRFVFFLGTTAELIKVVPVMLEFTRRGAPFEIVASGQNEIMRSELFAQAGLPAPVATLNQTLRRKSALRLLGWFMATFVRGLFKLPRVLGPRSKRRGTVLIVHGDTVSTVMGAVLGRLMAVKVAHVEAGLRSHNFLQPFPEELDRYLTAFFADYHFCPYASAVANLRHRGGTKVDTGFNTNIDSLAFARSLPQSAGEAIPEKPYFIFILHRQENLLNNALVADLIEVLEGLTARMRCLFVVHELTMTRLAELGLHERVRANPRITLSGRRPYAEFIRVLDGAEFIMTDGGGNQQECYYMGKPCLILRGLTESEEGVGTNVLISGNDRAVIRAFVDDYPRYRHPEVVPARRPSEIVVSTLMESA